ncbi:inorganic phosphate transporter [Nostoc sp. FACHB-87]|uniref:inorganic phosphate transporter n=1 Tax=Nostocaceae TaxID=1162 RepID=UPI001683113A|nr:MULTISPECIES: inorganic phosphate transporter [Nostocaceae]MBD2454177.1 inorganic phosphate transporter [Nostoc sp. FACHB-87]MBD2476127.1 inorganic phosphate transporter [Anabaena sp. FACHB-83]
MLIISLFLATLFLAYSHGANDNFKGVATLFGSGITSYQTAIVWATIMTFAGAVVSIFVAGTLVQNFSGQGIFPDEIANVPEIHLAVAIASGVTVLMAALTGFPISTTHSLTGGLLGAGLVAIGLKVNFSVLLRYFVLPLVLSPIIAILLAAGLYKLFVYTDSKFNLLSNQKLVDTLHFISAAVVSFARGFSQTPKLVSIILIIEYFSIQGGMLTIAMAMGLGGLLNSQRIAATMSTRLATIDSTQGLSANFVTGFLAIAATYFGLPISTTHVAVSSIVGAGLTAKQVYLRVFWQIIFAWIFTLPATAIISGIAYRLLQG